MKSYYSDLTVLKLNEASKAMVEARQYAADADAPSWMLKNMKSTVRGIQNRIDDILKMRISDSK